VEQVAAEGLKKFLLDKVSNAGKGSVNKAVASKTADTQQAESARPAAVSIDLKEEISQTTYPLSGTWLAMKIVSRIVSPFVYWAFFGFVIFSKALNDIASRKDLPLFVLIYVGVSIVSAIIHVIGLFIWKKNYAFNFTSDNIYYKEGVISLSEKHMPYSSIQDVTVTQGVLERFLGLGKVVIENAAQQQMVVGRNGRQMVGFAGIILQGMTIAEANKITEILKTTVLGKDSSRHGL